VNIEQAKEYILAQGLSDWVGFGTITWVVEQQLPAAATRDEKISLATAMIKSLLEDDLIRVGSPFDSDSRGFVAWDLPIDETIKRIETEWRALPEEPNIGDIGWFENTERGEKLALDAYQTRYGIGSKWLSVWLTGDRTSPGPNFDCMLDLTETGKIVGVEIFDFRRQLEGATVAPVRGNDEVHWSYDQERDLFYLRIKPQHASNRMKTSGKSRVDSGNRVIGLHVAIPKAKRGGPTLFAQARRALSSRRDSHHR
jgi:hypothetical protein